MALILKSFSNDIDLESPDNKERFFMVFMNTKTDKEVRLPVPSETVEALLREVYGSKPPAGTEDPPPPAPPRGSFQFVGEDDEDGETVATSFTADDSGEGEAQDGFGSEDEVPPL